MVTTAVRLAVFPCRPRGVAAPGTVVMVPAWTIRVPRGQESGGGAQLGQALRLRPTASPFGARFPTRLTIPFKALNVSGAASSSASTNLSFDASGNEWA